jgi:hypothetical protein
MALARIISRSHACSRELALDLLARGYAVEIVSPDAIPDNIADLELRVDTGPEDRLIANVEAHDGERSASLDFVHHLKAPMVDFMRRRPTIGEAVHFPEEPVSFNAETSIQDVELPADVPQLMPKAVSPTAEILFDRGDVREDGARLISPPDPVPSLPMEPPSYFAVEASEITPSTIAPSTIAPSTIAQQPIVQPRREPPRHHRPAGWFWRAALTFASVVLLALVLGFGMRRTGIASDQSSGAAPGELVAAASTDVVMPSAAAPEKDTGKDLGHVSALAASPPAIKSEGKSDHVPKESQAAKLAAPGARTTTAGAGPRISRWHGDDLIARDTVTYLDERYKPAPKAKPAQRWASRHPSVRKHDGGTIAASTVTYLNHKPAPKVAKPGSAIKHHSNPN